MHDVKNQFKSTNLVFKVVGSIDQMEVDDPANAEKNSGSAGESKNNSNNSKTLDSDKAKGRRKLYVGSQALGFRRDHMEVGLAIVISFVEIIIYIYIYLWDIIFCYYFRFCHL